jgi:hypothetical protein
MLISHSKKFIFIKTSKTAGTSVEKYFEKDCLPLGQYNPEVAIGDEKISEYGIVGFRGEGEKNMKWYNHLPAVKIKEFIGDAIWNEYFKFTIVRNPFDRLISLFWFDMKIKYHIDLKGQHSEKVREYFNNWIIEKDLPSDKGLITIDGKLCADYAMRYESHAEDIQYVCGHLNIDATERTLKNFKSQFRDKSFHYRDLISDDMKQSIIDSYSWEMQTFGYTY